MIAESLRGVLRHYCLVEARSPIPHVTSEVVIRDAKANEIPKKLIHTTHDAVMVSSIQQHGFNLKKFGYTARKFRSPEWLTQYDPTGVYTIAADSGEEKYETRPYLLLKANIHKALFMEETSSVTNSKKELSLLFGGKTKAKLRSALMSLGYDAVLRKGSEQIILDPSILTVIEVGNV